ncbi:penicillin-binding transpeptidase domain-containing protein [Micromonospora sp. NBC_01813]|uniref:penicillin-binding transpeptidase domain-containing protein n=1 Tax=Micromonospora sp. NBC_01813 TaxID=2975988 RepID=UPI002DDAD08F|nr:penicillin-binding transpeptidase domain-containing protein [Micromonospora sp. NBC_01813]WSA08888.1 penicillin-binding transpeptidase domain-containing protein [Micromonospora sp. NBC_01813]
MRYEAARPHRQPIRRLRWSAALTAALVLTGTALTGCSSDDGPERTVDAFVDGWLAGDVSTIGFITPAGQRLPATDVGEELAALVGDLSDTPPQLRRDGEADVTADIATNSLAVEWTLPGDVRWSYTTSIRLRQAADDGWQIIWDPAIVHEQLAAGDRFQLNRLAPRRGPVLDGAGEPVVAPRDVVVIGVQPSEVVSPDALVDDLDAAFRAIRPPISPPIDLTDLPDRLAAAKPDAFVDVVTLRKEAYDQVAGRIFDLPGTRFRSEQRDLAPTREFARALLGTVDPVQRQDMETHPGRYEIGDMVGHGGLQGGYEERLRGVPGYSVQIAGTAPDGTVSADEVLFSSDARPGDPLRTTLDVATQTAADAALAGQARRSALVAVRISDGALVAVANGPDGGTENLAFTAQVPPGSTFKMVSTLGLLESGAVGPDVAVDCPKTATVDGRAFTNANGFELGRVPFRTVFAKSCNTTFANLAPELGADGLAEAGRLLGLEGEWRLGVSAFTGKVSTGGAPAERAAAAFGQGTTLVSPLAMAGATAAVARGQWRQPTLIAEPAPQSPAPDGPQLDAAAVDALRAMMRAAVTDGTAEALRDVPGEPVYGKTGTAEYDNDPANTHAWFIGWQGDVAFAVFVEQGGSGSGDAVPIAETFLRSLTTN